MGLDVWFAHDVARILSATQEAMRSSTGAVAPLDLDRAAAYRQGFSDALRAVALAFGISLSTLSEAGAGGRDRWPLPPAHRLLVDG